MSGADSISRVPLYESRRAWIGVVILTVGLRLGFALAAPHMGIFGSDNGGDGLVAHGSDGYEKIAISLLHGDGYRIRTSIAPTMLRNPGYIGLLVIAFAIFGHDRLIGHVVQALMSGLVVILMRLLGRPVIGPRATFIACVLFAFYPADWIACSRYLAEPFFAVVLLTSLLVLRGFLARPSWVSAIGVGCLCGALSLIKSVATYLLPFMIIWMIVLIPQLRRRTRLWRHGVSALLACGVVLLPWGAWNYARSGHWVFTTTAVGYSLFDADYVNQWRGRDVPRQKLWIESRVAARELARQQGIIPDRSDPWAFEFASLTDEYEMAEMLKRHAVASIKSNPRRYAVGVLHSLAEFWYQSRSVTSSRLGMVLNLPLVLAAILAFAIARVRRHPEARCWAGVVVYMNVISAMSLAVARYSVPIMPLVLLLAGATISRLLNGSRNEFSGLPDEPGLELISNHPLNRLQGVEPLPTPSNGRAASLGQRSS